MILYCVSQFGEKYKFRTCVLDLIPLMRKLRDGGVHSFVVAVENSKRETSMKTFQLAIAANHFACMLNETKMKTKHLYLTRRSIKTILDEVKLEQDGIDALALSYGGTAAESDGTSDRLN